MSRERTRRYRERRAKGRLVLPVEIDEAAVADALVNARRLRPELADYPEALRKAIERLVADFAEDV